MSKISAINNVYTAGIVDERLRVNVILSKHLEMHQWTQEAIADTIQAVGLNTSAVTYKTSKYCTVCSGAYPEAIVYGQPLHLACAESLWSIVKRFTKEN